MPLVQAAVGPQDIHEVARDLLEGLGAAVLQALAGAKDPGLPAQWASPDGPEPDSETQQRLRLAHQVWHTVAEFEGPSVALAWLVGSNPRLGDATPISCIRNLEAADVLGAAQVSVHHSVSRRDPSLPRRAIAAADTSQAAYRTPVSW